jgi:glyoxylate carboligase
MGLTSEKNGEVTAVVEKAKRQIQLANEEKQRALETANRHMEIARKALKRSRELTTENAQLKKHTSGKTFVENRQPRQTVRLDGSRRSARPVTSRPTIVENQSNKTAVQKPTRINTIGISEIAAQVDDLV